MFRINIKVPTGTKLSVEVAESSSVGELKAQLSAPEQTGTPAGEQRLIFKGRILKDDQTMGACGEWRPRCGQRNSFALHVGLRLGVIGARSGRSMRLDGRTKSFLHGRAPGVVGPARVPCPTSLRG